MKEKQVLERRTGAELGRTFIIMKILKLFLETLYTPKKGMTSG